MDQWRWLGFQTRELVYGILDEATKDPDAKLDVLAFDFDEPDLIRALQRLGSRLRLFLDDSRSHVAHDDEDDPPEVEAKQAIVESAGGANVKTGHFSALAHDKIIILTRGDGIRKVLSGSANFSVRGLYAQSNSVFVFDGEDVGALYARMFEAVWTEASGFRSADLAKEWFDLSGDGLPAAAVSFAPHSDSAVSLDRVAASIDGAESSVLFAIMNIGTASGPVMDKIEHIRDRKDLYAYGTTQALNGDLKATTPTDPDSPFIPWSYLRNRVPVAGTNASTGAIACRRERASMMVARSKRDRQSRRVCVSR